ncbi:Transposable element P transposase [Frankliniella fusca]|uniref:Transposable element P transposase n=1 Tax=Frankliniella fusca TaxID=407009 RepID=A0AAE1GWZ5_9NEOP|nr:Transposable element P transposase [Frankliniella fusca]
MSDEDSDGDAAGTSSTAEAGGSDLVCDECGKTFKSERGRNQHKQTKHSDASRRKRWGSAKAQVQSKKKGTKESKAKSAISTPVEKKKITVVVEDTNNDDAQEGNLPSTGQKKVSVMTENFSVGDDTEELSSVDVLICDNAENVSDFSYPADSHDVCVADCSLLDDSLAATDIIKDTAETFDEIVIKDVVQEFLMTSPAEEEEDFLFVDESGQIVYPDFEELESDFMIMETIQEEEWDEDPLPKQEELFGNILNPFECLLANLQSTVPDGWIIDASKKCLRLTLLSPCENVSVQKCIIWTGETIKIFVHNRALPQDCFIWKSIEGLDCLDFTDISLLSEHLLKLCYLVESCQVCKGVRLYSNLWSKAAEDKIGFAESEFYEEVACFRDNECPLLVGGSGSCVPCKKLFNLLRCRNYRENLNVDKDKKKTNYRYLTGEEAKERLRETQEEKRLLLKKLYKMKEKLRAYIEKSTVPVSTEFGTDLAKLFRENEKIMTPVQKLFWTEQLKSLSKQKNPQQMRWNPFVIRLALHLQMLSSSAYDYFQNFLNLPSKRILYDYSHYTEAKEGPQDVVMQMLSTKCREKCKEKSDKYFYLIFDEVDIRSGIVLKRSTGEVVGYVNLSDVEKELAAVEAEISEKTEPSRQLAKKLLVYLASGITNPLQAIVGVFTTGGNFTAGQIYTRTWDIVYRMENLGMKVLCLTCDGASVNKKFFKMHTNLDPTSRFIYKTQNIACGEDRPMFLITDPVHIVKSLRNNFSNSFSHKKTREMWKNGQIMSWAVIENVFYMTRSSKFLDLKLTKAHIKLTSHSCMKVIFAVQVMSLSMVKAIEYFKEELTSKNLCVEEVQTFIKLVNDWFDCLNGNSDPKGKRIKENDNLQPYIDINDPRFTLLTDKVLHFFNEWHKDVMNRPGKYTKDRREKMFISMLTFESLHTTTLSFIAIVKFLLEAGVSHVDARKLNQDKLEQFFGKLRMSFGGNRNPTASEAIQKIFIIDQLDDAARPPTKGSTEVTQEWLPDESPLPKKPRKM